MADSRGIPSPSRRTFLQLSASAAAATAAGFRLYTEPMLARAAAPYAASHDPHNAVMIDSNENPLGPSASAREAIAAIIPHGGRYRDDLSDALVKLFAQQEGFKLDYIRLFAGSSEPLHYTVLAYTSPARSYVTADPGFEGGIHMSKISGARVVNVPLTKAYAHDVKAMAAATPDAGVIYICNPNNPTGTLTSHSDIEYALEKKPKNSILLVDEAYIHFSDAPSALDLVKADKDLIVLRTFSKLYGMAGIRCGFAIGRPDLIARLDNFGGNFMPITAVVAAAASLKDPQLIAERKQINAAIRDETFQWLDRNGYSYIPSQSNFFMLDTKRPAKAVIDAMAQQNIFIGRIWPVMPTYARITVGTREEMARFQSAFKKVMDGTVVGPGSLFPAKPTITQGTQV
jgi:histidinol-phosphate aminotransferase